LVEDTNQTVAADVSLGDEGDGFVGGVIDDREALARAPHGVAIKDAVPRPYLVGGGRSKRRLSHGVSDLLATAAADFQARPGIQTFDALVIHLQPGLPQLLANHVRTVAPMPLCQGHDLLPQFDVSVRLRLAAQCAGAHSHHA
jgi:hypothetical protein